MQSRTLNTTKYYHSFGSSMAGRSFSNSEYKYGFNTQEKDNEIAGEGNSYSAEFWQYDSRLGRRFNIDLRPITSISVYACFNNNPIWLSDVKGDSSVCDANGKMLYEDPSIFKKDKKDRDLRIFMKVGDKVEYIGDLGSTLKTKKMINRILSFNKGVAITYNVLNTAITDNPLLRMINKTFSWASLVLPNSLWDYKNRKSLIFGFAWKYEQYHIDVNKELTGNKTEFTSRFGNFKDASDFGNFNAGYTGVYAGVPRYNQYALAGLGEIVKDPASALIKLKEIITCHPPLGDSEDDFKTNTKGMNQADKEIDKMPWYQRMIIRKL